MRIYTPHTLHQERWPDMPVYTIRKLLQRGELRGRVIGGRWRIPESAVAEWEAGADDPAAARHPETRGGAA